MKYKYSVGEFTLNVDIEPSILEGADEGVDVKGEIHAAMKKNVVNELYVNFAKETNNVVVNEEPVTLDAGQLNKVLETMATKFATWLAAKGAITVVVTEEE